MSNVLESAEKEWREFCDKVMPDVPKGHPQYRDMKMAFFAGVLIGLLAEGEENEIRMLQEVIAFKVLVMSEYGERN